jgi:hypothetical protein
MFDPTDDLMDRAIEAEKLRALQRYRLHPGDLVPRAVHQTPARSHGDWGGVPKLWRMCTALALVSFSLVLVVYMTPRVDAPAGISSRTIERAFSAAIGERPEPTLALASLSSSDEAGSDIAWTVQRVLGRAELIHYSTHDLRAVVSQALAYPQERDRLARLTPANPQELAKRIVQLARTEAVARSFVRLNP